MLSAHFSSMPSDQPTWRAFLPSPRLSCVPRSQDPTSTSVGIDFVHRFGHEVVLLHVLLERNVAELPVAPHFVADAPILHVVGIVVTRLDVRHEPPIVSSIPLAYSTSCAAE